MAFLIICSMMLAWMVPVMLMIVQEEEQLSLARFIIIVFHNIKKMMSW